MDTARFQRVRSILNVVKKTLYIPVVDRAPFITIIIITIHTCVLFRYGFSYNDRFTKRLKNINNSPTFLPVYRVRFTRAHNNIIIIG